MRSVIGGDDNRIWARSGSCIYETYWMSVKRILSISSNIVIIVVYNLHAAWYIDKLWNIHDLLWYSDTKKKIQLDIDIEPTFRFTYTKYIDKQNSKCQKLVFAGISFYGHVWLRRGLNSSGSVTRGYYIPLAHSSSIRSFKLQLLYTCVSSSYYHSITINVKKVFISVRAIPFEIGRGAEWEPKIKTWRRVRPKQNMREGVFSE